MSDAELVERAREGDTAAFGQLVDRHRTAAFRAALAVLGSPAEAEDAAQDACVQAFKRLSQYRGEASFRTWLMRITWRTAITRRRRLAWTLRWSRLDDATTDPPAPPEQASPERGLLDTELAQTVRRVVQGLPAKFREPLLLAAGDTGYAEIAEVLGVAEGTVKWRVSEARRLLKARLQRIGVHHG